MRGYYQHSGLGWYYEVTDVVTHTETGETLVVYHRIDLSPGADGYGPWARPQAMFEEQVEVDGKLVPRFRRLTAEDRVKVESFTVFCTRCDEDLARGRFRKREDAEAARDADPFCEVCQEAIRPSRHSIRQEVRPLWPPHAQQYLETLS